MKSSSNYLKAGRIAAKLCQICRIELTPEDILSKISSQAELDFYYTNLMRWLGAGCSEAGGRT